MDKISFILLALCLSTASMDTETEEACPTCEENPTSDICRVLATYVTCMNTTDSEAANCTYNEKSANVTSIMSAMAILRCSGVSLASTLSLILSFSGLAYLLNIGH